MNEAITLKPFPIEMKKSDTMEYIRMETGINPEEMITFMKPKKDFSTCIIRTSKLNAELIMDNDFKPYRKYDVKA
jgi:hypothetical protein